jgi:2,3-bisphosphoglycerate-independent phosphoglycerate mutase
MNTFELMERLVIRDAASKIVLLVIDGLGGLGREPGGPTELEAARTPHLDALAGESVCGLSLPINSWVTPGSGPSHLALFGYDPLKYRIGRGVLEALGIGFDLEGGDVAARGNFCTVDDGGVIVDRRAGRIPSEKAAELCEMLRRIELPGVELWVEPVREYRFVAVLRGKGLRCELTDSDPQTVGSAPLPVTATIPEAEPTARLVESFVQQGRAILADRHPANMFVLRGFSQRPEWPTVEEVFGLRAAAIASYPMYRGLAALVGMQTLPATASLEEEFDLLESHYGDFDFFYVHVKKTDSAGEDGDFDRKVAVLEEADALLPRIRALNPEVIVVSGDHSTPAALKAHSWHPLPTLVWSRRCRPDDVTSFSESACALGAMGRFPAKDILPLAMANALRLKKFGA